jgi:hypothetical protein
MKVRAFSTHAIPQWRWRIVDHHGATIEESSEAYSTIAVALSAGTDRIRALRVKASEAGAS